MLIWGIVCLLDKFESCNEFDEFVEKNYREFKDVFIELLKNGSILKNDVIQPVGIFISLKDPKFFMPPLIGCFEFWNILRKLKNEIDFFNDDKDLQSSFEYLLCARGFALSKLSEMEKYLPLDLSNLELKTMHLVNANLPDTDFSQSILVNVDFSNSNLQKSWFESTSIDENTKFIGANLIGATFKSIVLDSNEFKYFLFKDACIGDFLNVNLKYVDFQNSQFVESGVEESNFSAINFKKAQIAKSKILSTDFSDCNFQESQFIDSEIMESNFSNCQFQNFQFIENSICYVGFSRGLFKNVEFVYGIINKDPEIAPLNFIDVTFKEIRFEKTSLNNLDVRGIRFEKALFYDCKFKWAFFYGMKIENLIELNSEEESIIEEFSNDQVKKTSFINVDFSYADLRHSTFINVDFANSIFIQTQLNGAIFENCNFDGAIFESDLQNVKFINCQKQNAKVMCKKWDGSFVCFGPIPDLNLP